MKRISSIFIPLFSMLMLSQNSLGQEATWHDVDGVVSIEAEKGKGTVKQIEGVSGQAVMFMEPEERMDYSVTFSQPGKYWTFILAKQGPEGGGEQNDVFVFLDGERTYAVDDVTRPEGIRSYGDWSWGYLAKGPGGHTPDNIRDDPVYVLVEEPGTYTFSLVYRSEHFAVDKVVLQWEDRTRPEGMGPDETLISTSAAEDSPAPSEE